MNYNTQLIVNRSILSYQFRCIKSVTTILFFILVIVAVSENANANSQITATGSYVINMRDNETINIAKKQAKADAIRQAVKKIGVYIEGYSKAENLQIVEDEVEILTVDSILITGERYSFKPYGKTIQVISEIDIKYNKNELMEKIRHKDDVALNQALNRENEIKQLIKNAEIHNMNINQASIITAGNSSSGLSQMLMDAKDLIDVMDYESAIEILDDVIEKDSNTSIAYYLRAQAYYEIGNYSAANDDINKSLQLLPNFDRAAHLKERIVATE